MKEITVSRMCRHAGLLFVASVTVCLLALVPGQAARGAEGLAGLLVYAFAAGFGLEFVGAAWTGVWHQRQTRSQPQS